MVEFLKRAPSSVVISVVVTVGIIVLSVIIGFTVLSAIGADTTEFSRFANSLMNAAGLTLSGGGFIAATAAAVSSSRTEKATNGGMTARLEQAAEQGAVRAVAKMTGGEPQ